MPATSRLRTRAAAIPAARLPEVLDVHMAAQFLTVSADTRSDLFQRGDLPGKKVGRQWLTTKTAVLRWLEESTKSSTKAQEDAALARAIDNGDHEALVAAMHLARRVSAGRASTLPGEAFLQGSIALKWGSHDERTLSCRRAHLSAYAS